MQRLADQIIVEVIKKELGLDDDHAWIRDQNKLIPGNNDLYVIVGMVDAKPYSSQTYMEQYQTPDSDPPTFQQVEVNRVNMRENIQIDIVSRSNAAILRRWEILAALKSIFAVQQQELYQFKIASLPTSFVNSSNAEGGSQLNRYSLVFPCLVWYKKSKALSPDGKLYYDDFYTRVDNEQTIGTATGLIEFEIKGDQIL